MALAMNLHGTGDESGEWSE
ncbi:uncharacterized protein G2W53_028575 [Senna tora]|uniref:Uncharacterized protein n=1 Tax=Senna tora TaxID=362788 RepID=A0A834T5M5_9FABA|nr:uncharacterized protein G2W53_028575 [Senna tora]